MAKPVKRYEPTDDHRALLPVWRDKRIANAMSTSPTDAREWARMVDAVERLYRAADLVPPPRERIVLVPSRASQIADSLTVAARGFQLASSYYWNGGNQWSGYVSYLSFFRHVAGLMLDYSKWDAYEVLAEIGPRFMHAEFCLVSMRPEVLTVDAQNRPHHDSGPFCRWRDGVALYAWHGVYCPAWVIESPESITAEDVLKEENAEVRRVMIERVGEEQFIAAGGGAHLHSDAYGSLYRLADETLAVRVINGTAEADGSRKVYWLYPHPELRPMTADGELGDKQPLTAHAAVASTYGLTAAQYQPALRT